MFVARECEQAGTLFKQLFENVPSKANLPMHVFGGRKHNKDQQNASKQGAKLIISDIWWQKKTYRTDPALGLDQ